MTDQDRLAILDVVAQYAFAFDDRDPDTYASCFASDGVLEIWFAGWEQPTQVVQGTDAIRKWAHDLFGGYEPGVHARQLPIATRFDDLGAGTARTRSFLVSTVHRSSEQMPFVPTTGVYRDEWRKVGGQWQLARRAIHHDRDDPARPY